MFHTFIDTQLKYLNLSACTSSANDKFDNLITDQSVGHLKGLSKLQNLNISHCQLTDRGVEHLKGLIQLQHLDLSGCVWITDKGVEHLKGLIQLQDVNLSGCRLITQKSFHLLANLSIQVLFF